MRKNMISFRKTKYGLPLVLLPFLVLFAYFLSRAFPQKIQSAAETGQIEGFNTNIPDPSLSEQKSNFELLLQLLEMRKNENYVQDLKEEFDKYSNNTDEEMSFEDLIQIVGDTISLASVEDDTENALRELQRKYFGENFEFLKQPIEMPEERQPKSAQADELSLIKEQLARVEAMLMGQTQPVNVPVREEEDLPEDFLIATRATGTQPNHFNTIYANKQKMFITAILDEAQTVVNGSRIRVRLLDDVFIGDKLFKQGSYLFGLVSGFSAQRVNVSITSVLYGDQILKTKLAIYDNDGIKGLYVPNSDFREIIQMAGGRMAQSSSMNISQGGNPYQQMLSQMGQDFYRTVTSTVSQKIKQNKAKLKYSTVIYLINEENKN